MRTPTESDFAPFAQLISQFGLPNPLDVLPQLQNHFESVGTSSQHLTNVSTQLNTMADHIDRTAVQVHWQGAAAPGFRKTVAQTTESLRNTAQVIQQTVVCNQDNSTTGWDVAVWITLAIAIVALAVAVAFAIAIAATGPTFGSSLLAWVVQATGATELLVAEVIAAIGTAAWLASGVLSELRAKFDNHPITCPVPVTPGPPGPAGPAGPTGPTGPTGTTPSTNGE